MRISALDTPKNESRFVRWYFGLLGTVLCLYALFGRGAAYIGLPPVFIGEVTLFIGFFLMLVKGRPMAITRSIPLISLCIFIVLGIMRTIPYLSTYGIMSLRDATLYGYGLFACIVYALIARWPFLFTSILLKFRRFTWIFISVAGMLFLISEFASGSISKIPGTSVRMLDPKGGDIMVHMAGAAALALCGIISRPTVFLLLCTLNFLLVGWASRAGMISFIVAMVFIFIFRPIQTKFDKLALSFGCVVALIAIINPQVSLHRRTVSVEQIVLNLKSTISDSQMEQLQGTKQWRLQWWNKIIIDTFNGPHFWQGRGFGINLADADGFQVTADKSLRSPHNSHLTVLARMGVPGFSLWILVQLSWLFSIVAAFLLSRARKDHDWAGIFAFLGAYGIAFLTNAAFDVFLEGPMGGIWFWIVFGFGCSAIALYKQCPEVIRT
jgi:hypothetical protein